MVVVEENNDDHTGDDDDDCFCFICFPDSCRSLNFNSPVQGHALEGHVIKNISLSVGMRSSCRGRCTLESNCVSFNIGSPINDQVMCQLSDSDHTRHPEDLKPRVGITYRGTEVRIVTPSTLV